MSGFEAREASNRAWLAADGPRVTASFHVVVGGMSRRWQWVIPYIALGVILLGAVVAWTVLGAPTLRHLVAHNRLAFLLVGGGAYVAFLAIGVVRAATSGVRLVVGADGVLLRRRFRRSVFRGYHEIVDVRRDDRDVVLALGSGDVTHEVVRFGLPDGDLQVTTLLARIADTRARFQDSEASSDLANVLARGDRDVHAWNVALQALMTQAPTYRTQPVPLERLWCVLEDPKQPATARAGAAVALRGRLDEEAKVRLRVATAACASAELRGAFIAAAEEDADDERVERALRAMRA